MARGRNWLTTLLLVAIIASVGAQNDAKTAAQRRVVESLEKKIAAEEREIEKLRKGRSASQGEVKRLVRQINSRNQLIEETQQQASLLSGEIDTKNQLADSLQRRLDAFRAQYAEMTREAYRNYKQQNYLSYIFSARDFSDLARRLAALREMAALRERHMGQIAQLSETVQHEREALSARRLSLDSVSKKLAAQKQRLERDARTARASVKKLSKREKEAVSRKLAQEQQLEVAISELRKLTKGNTAGASFSTKTTGLRLPVAEGRVKRYKENMAEITGAKGAKVIAIYEGKVIDTKRNRITNKHEVYVAHGEYVTSYANMGSICVEKGQKVAKNQVLGTVGSEVNVMTMQTEYKLLFGIYPPPGKTMSAASCFKR